MYDYDEEDYTTDPMEYFDPDAWEGMGWFWE